MTPAAKKLFPNTSRSKCKRWTSKLSYYYVSCEISDSGRPNIRGTYAFGSKFWAWALSRSTRYKVVSFGIRRWGRWSSQARGHLGWWRIARNSCRGRQSVQSSRRRCRRKSEIWQGLTRAAKVLFLLDVEWRLSARLCACDSNLNCFANLLPMPCGLERCWQLLEQLFRM